MSSAQRAESPLRINVLGSVECWDGDERVHLGGLIQERVLAALVLEAGRVLSVSQLVDAVWEDVPPATAAHQVRKAVARLRQIIPGGGGLIITQASGYRVSADAAQLDVKQFSALLDQARAELADRRAGEAVEHLEGALALWRGTVLSGDGGEPIRAAGTALLERRAAAIEQLIDLRLARGETAELVGELRAYVAAYPLQERLRGQLMLALFRSGRQADALEEFERVRALLSEDLGIDPGSDLTRLHERILRNDPALARPVPEAGPRPVAEVPAGPPAAAHALPHDLPDFVGRERELDHLRSYLETASSQGPRIVAIDGMGGVGKTSFAVRAAYSVSGRYPDGQLYLDLHGFTPAGQPMTAPAAAEALLRMLGTPVDHLPDGASVRLNLWRATIAEKSVVLLLDNVSDVAQVLPLLPPNSECLVLITSRTRLVDLDGVLWISLGTMTDEDSAAMASAVLTSQRTAVEPEALAELIELCGHLPLAIRIALSRLANRPRWSIGYLVDRMSDESRRLDELRSGERGVELTLKISYEGLKAKDREAFRLLGLHPGRDIDVHSAAALLGTSPEEAEATLEVLLDAHMLQQYEFGYYRFHDLVRSFVHRLLRVAGQSAGGDISPALGRLLDYLVCASDQVCDLLFAGRLSVPAGGIGRQAVPPELDEPEQARKWLERERTTLLAAAVLAHEQGLDRHVTLLARNVVFQLDAAGLYSEFAEASQLAVASSRRLGEPELLRLSLSNLAVANWKLGRFDAGIAASSEALKIADDLGDRRGFAKDTGMLGLFKGTTGQFDEALGLLRESIRLKRELGAARTEAESLVNLSSLYEQWGRYPEAVEAAGQALALDLELDIREHQIVARADLALAYLGVHADEEADEQLARDRELVEDFGAAGEVAMVFALSALTNQRLGRHEEAARYAEIVREHRREHWNPTRQVVIDNILGKLYRAQGNDSDAALLHEAARTVAASIGYRVEEARALLGLGAAESALGRTEEGQRHQRRAEEIFTELGVPPDARS
ncbi:tetratricopeptide repeat protein [Amycolatopsis sp. NBC_00345]|uniref:AfsR/SARP family transcriptional regulator n=1 Tax=Amycolatopsis sp. NBC_00345 TaxID=2975955 RepID=UPI002E272A30